MPKMQNRLNAAWSNHGSTASRTKEEQEARLEISAELSPEDPWGEHDPHVYDGERCIYCNTNVYDEMIYGPFDCLPDRDPHKHTTETGEPK